MSWSFYTNGNLKTTTPNIGSVDWKDSVRAGTTAPITLSGAQTIDTVAVIADDRVLVKDQGTASQNGVYVAATGAWARSSDADINAEVTAGLAVFISEGSANVNQAWILTTDDPIIVGTTGLTFTQISGNITTLDSLTDVVITTPSDGTLLRYDTTGTQWANTTSSTLLLSDAGQLQVPTVGVAGGLLLGGDVNLYRAATDILKTDDSINIGGFTADTTTFTSDGTINTSLKATAGTILLSRASATNNWLVTGVAADAFGRLHARVDGGFEWGSGTVTQDVTLTRAAGVGAAAVGILNVTKAGAATRAAVRITDLPIQGDELTNQVYVDRINFFMS